METIPRGEKLAAAELPMHERACCEIVPENRDRNGKREDKSLLSGFHPIRFDFRFKGFGDLVETFDGNCRKCRA